MFESLRSFSDSQLITGSKIARAQEHSGLLAMIGFIAEIDRRQLFLRRGYSSLYEYCVRELGYSESQAMRRITAARCIVKYPDVFELLKSNEINLGTIARVSKIMTPQNCGDVLNSIRRKSLREVEAIVAEHEPVASFPPDRVRAIVAKVPAGHDHSLGDIYLRSEGKKDPSIDETTLLEPHRDPTPREPRQDVASAGAIPREPRQDAALPDPTPREPHYDSTPEPQDHASARVAPHTLERRTRVEFTARQELLEKLERIRAIASHRLPARASMEQIINFMADYVIHREDPIKRHQRREARRLKRDKTAD